MAAGARRRALVSVLVLFARLMKFLYDYTRVIFECFLALVLVGVPVFETRACLQPRVAIRIPLHIQWW